MSKKYLDSKGLSYLWQKIKSEISLNPGPQGPQGEQGLTLISTIPSVDELHNIATTDELHINDAYILDPNYDYTTHTPEYRKGALWVFRGEILEDSENKIIEETSAGIFEYVCNLQGQKGTDGADGSTGPQGEKGTGSLSYIVATCDEHVIANYYNENMCIGDLVIDNGEVDSGRRGNMYRIINIIENPDLSKYNAQYPPSNPAIIIDKNIVCNLKGDTINGKYLFDSILNSYSFGYQREIIENIKVRRLKDDEKYLLSEIYGVDWSYINLDNKVQEGLKGKLYSNEVDYIDEISDIKYVNLSIGGTLFNCDSVIIPEYDYNIYDFTYKYLSGVNGTNAFAEGDATLAEGDSSHAEGEWNTAYGDYSHAEGEFTTAQGQASHTEGEDTLAIGDVSHAEGARTLAVGDYSHTEGFDTVAQNAYEHAQGVYNVSNKETDTFGDKNTIFSIGIGESEENRRNAVEVIQNGDVYINGVGDYDGKTLSNAKSLQKILGSGDLGDSIKRIEVSDISKFYYGFEDLSFYGLKSEDIDMLLDNKGEIEITVNLLPMFLNIIAGQDILKDVSSTFPYNLLFKNSNKTKFSTSNSEIQMLPQNVEELSNLVDLMSIFSELGDIVSENPIVNGDNGDLGEIHLMGASLGANANAHIIFMNWVLAQLYLPFCNFEIPKCFINAKINASSVFDLKLNTAYLISENKLGIVTLYDDVETLDGLVLKSLSSDYSGNLAPENSDNGNTSINTYSISAIIDRLKSLALFGMRGCMIDNLLKDVSQNNTITDMYETILYVINQYTILYKDEMEAYISKFGFSDLDEYLNAVYDCLYLAIYTLPKISTEAAGPYMSTKIDPNNIETLYVSHFSSIGGSVSVSSSDSGSSVSGSSSDSGSSDSGSSDSGSSNTSVSGGQVFFPKYGLSWIEPQILFNVCNNIVYGNRTVVQNVEE